jgi:hypothetical protein
MHARASLLVLCAVSSAAHAGRCGPNRSPKGHVCCNNTCGISFEPNPAMACIQPHCGWDRHLAGGNPGIMPATWLHPFSSVEVDAALRAGLSTEPFEGLVSLRIPANETFIFRAEIERQGSLPGLRYQHITGELIWNIPLGTPGTQGALHAGLTAAQSALIDAPATSYRAFATKQIHEQWRPRAHVGLSSVSGRSIWSLASTARAVALSDEGQPEIGFHAGLSVGMDVYWLHVATQVSVEAEKLPGSDRLDVGLPAGVYWSEFNSHLLVGIETRVGGSPGPHTGVGWQVGVRLRTFGNPSDLRRLRDVLTR